VKGVEVPSSHFTAEVKPVQPGRTYELIVRVPVTCRPDRTWNRPRCSPIAPTARASPYL
jgi:hypothetical protein